MKTINSFNGDFRFLSNFSLHSFIDKKGMKWKTVEHFFQASKTNDEKQKNLIMLCNTPSQTKHIGRKVKLIKDWDKKKLNIMYRALKMKFDQNLDIQKKLISTFEYKLIEGNYWHDNYWGNCFCNKCKNINGQNYLGNLLMLIRKGYIY